VEKYLKASLTAPVQKAAEFSLTQNDVSALLRFLDEAGDDPPVFFLILPHGRHELVIMTTSKRAARRSAQASGN
jgi:hypothetical protein